ncbi:YesL family protein [Oceanobacillus salinisoli]|uniref:YesL family protein n=1 Tax=Oceanobacillus salinisoli TaxID=2678611 RepID=UPI0012E2A15C
MGICISKGWRFFYNICDWSLKLATINLMWVFCTILGLSILGVFPSTIAMISVIRRWTLGEIDTPIIKTFWIYFVSEIKKGNILGLFLLLIGLIIFFNINFYHSFEHPIFDLISIMFILFSVFYGIIILHLLPIYANYNFTIVNYIKFSFMTAIKHPIVSILMVIILAIINILLVYIPGLILFFGVSLSATALTVIANHFIHFKK